jgi:hypothetical protein
MSRGGAQSDSTEYTSISSTLDKIYKKHREFETIVNNRQLDKMETALASMRVEHARMLLMQFEYQRRLVDSTKQSPKELFDLSRVATMCSAILSTIARCEDTMHQAVGDVGSREIPVIEEYVHENLAKVSDNENHKSSKSSGDEVPLLLLYRMEGCGACKNFMPAWKAFTEQFNSKTKLRTEEIEYYAKKKLCHEASVGEFPTVKLFYVKDGEREVDTCQD